MWQNVQDHINALNKRKVDKNEKQNHSICNSNNVIVQRIFDDCICRLGKS